MRFTAEIAQRGTRVLYFVGAKDFLITGEQREHIDSALTESGVRHEVVVYPSAGHAFLSEEPDVHDPVASTDAWRRTFRALAEELAAIPARASAAPA